MTRIIKRYSNRKCYDTDTSKYVNIEEIEELVRSEADFKIIDNQTQEDITAIYLSKIIMNQEKENKDIFTPLFLKREIQRRSEPIINVVKKSYQKGSELLSQEYAEAKKMVSKLSDKGLLSNKEALEVVSDFFTFTKKREAKLYSLIEKKLSEVIKKMGLPTQSEVEALEKKVDELIQKIEKLEEEK